MSAVDGGHAGLADRLGEGVHNVLLLAPPFDDRGDDACVDLLTVTPPADRDVLYVTFVQSADDRLESWRRHQGDATPNRLGVIDVGGSTRATAAASASAPGPTGPVRIETIGSPGNLTDLGIKINGFLQEWEADDAAPTICFHSLTTLLQYAELQRVFRFLHVLTGRVRAVDGLAHFHLDPGAHEPHVENTLMTLFDAAARLEDGEWAIRSR